MRKLFAASVLFAIIACNSSKKKEEKTAGQATLEQRLSEFMKYNDEMNLDKMMDYIYPKLFTIAPRKQLQKALEDAYNNEEVAVDLDSLKLEKIHPRFEMNGGSYAKVDYSMLLVMKLKKAVVPGSDARKELLLKDFAEEFGEGNVRYDERSNTFRILQKSTSVAVKDKYAKEWSFAELNKDDMEMLRKIFSKEVLDKLDTYN